MRARLSDMTYDEIIFCRMVALGNVDGWSLAYHPEDNTFEPIEG